MQGGQQGHDSFEEKTAGAVLEASGMLEALAYIIQKVSCEVISYVWFDFEIFVLISKSPVYKNVVVAGFKEVAAE